MSSSIDSSNACVIVIADLFTKISAQRKLLKQTPIEDRAMISRCTLRFNLDSHQKLDFGVERIELDDHDVANLEKVVNELFGVHFEGAIKKMCSKTVKTEMTAKSARERTMARINSINLEKVEVEGSKPEHADRGFVSRIKSLFGGK